jgi:DNA-binding NarL/FixJ family response regulator
MQPAKSRILVVDDHAILRDGLARVINRESDLAVCAEAEDAPQALEQAQKSKPDLALVDISLEGMNGIELTKALRSRYPNLFILVISMHKESLYAERALMAGANGYIMKREGGSRLLSAVRQVLKGQIYLSEEMKELILQKTAQTGKSIKHLSPIDRFSDRELEVFQRIGRGYGTRQIAEELHVSMKTVETYRERLREKLGVKTSFELVQYAIEWAHNR